MTLDAEMIAETVESAAKLAKVQLASSDWRKLVLFSTAVVLALLFVVYQLSGSVVRSEITRLDTVDGLFNKRIEIVEVRMGQLEALHTDMAVVKADLSWIRQELETRKRMGYPTNDVPSK